MASTHVAEAESGLAQCRDQILSADPRRLFPALSDAREGAVRRPRDGFSDVSVELKKFSCVWHHIAGRESQRGGGRLWVSGLGVSEDSDPGSEGQTELRPDSLGWLSRRQPRIPFVGANLGMRVVIIQWIVLDGKSIFEVISENDELRNIFNSEGCDAARRMKQGDVTGFAILSPVDREVR